MNFAKAVGSALLSLGLVILGVAAFVFIGSQNPGIANFFLDMASINCRLAALTGTGGGEGNVISRMEYCKTVNDDQAVLDLGFSILIFGLFLTILGALLFFLGRAMNRSSAADGGSHGRGLTDGIAAGVPIPIASNDSFESQLLQLNSLREKGLINEEEFGLLRTKLLESRFNEN